MPYLKALRENKGSTLIPALFCQELNDPDLDLGIYYFITVIIISSDSI
jgi:hypothetical protein